MAFQFELTSDDPLHPAFYYKIIISYILLTTILFVVNSYLKSKEKKESSEEENNKSMKLTYEQKKLKLKFLCAYVITRAGTWGKSPYLFTLYLTYHKFTVDEIGFLYIIDAVFSFLSGPIFGSMADKYGRRLFSALYNVFVICNITLRITGIKSLAYLAQIFTGLGSTLLSTPFESWMVYESSLVFPGQPKEQERFLQSVFKDQALYDSICSIVVSCITAILFTFFGILAPLFFAILMSIIGFCIIRFTWNENKPNSISKKSTYDSFFIACKELKKRNVLTVGIVESIWNACLNLYIFIWTPVLKETSSTGEMNVGFIFIVMVIMTIVGTLIFELLVIHLHLKYYPAYCLALTYESFAFYMIYRTNDFTIRMILFSSLNIVSGFYPPLNSIVKSKILVEKYRATLMNIFKIPVSIYFIAVLFFLKQISPLNVVLISFIMVASCMIRMSTLITCPVEGDLALIEGKKEDEEIVAINNEDGETEKLN